MEPPDAHPPRMINVNTGVSIGLIGLVCTGIWLILNAVSGTKTEVGATRQELNGRFDKMELRVTNLESARNSWTNTDMFRWSVHLQQANPQIKVPEPEVTTK
mgnify:CR=1 FL=1